MRKKTVIKILISSVFIWYVFCLVALNGNKGMIGVGSIGELTVYLRELDLRTAKEVRDFLDQSTLIDELEQKTIYDVYKWKAYHHGKMEQISENQWIWGRFSNNSYKVTLIETEESWILRSEPLQEYVYLHPLWYRIATLDLYKMRCPRTDFDGLEILNPESEIHIQSGDGQ